jgi:hypothetical protein
MLPHHIDLVSVSPLYVSQNDHIPTTPAVTPSRTRAPDAAPEIHVLVRHMRGAGIESPRVGGRGCAVGEAV